MTKHTYFDLRAAGIDTVAPYAGYSYEELLACGATPDDAADFATLGLVYFGATSFKKRQRESLAAARENKHGIATLLIIEKYVRKAKDSRKAWELRETLCHTAAADIPDVARAALKEINPPKEPEAGISVRRGEGMWSLRIDAPESEIADIWNQVKDADDKVAAFTKNYFEGTARTPKTTNVVVHLNELDQIVDGNGEEITLRLSNGTTMTGAQFVTQTLADHGYITLVHPVKGAVNLYRSERFASKKQRTMLQALYQTCQWKDCRKPIDECQFHHVDGWNGGGLTNINNLVPLCRYHNSVNEDDGPADRRGKMVRGPNGRIVWRPPWA